MKWKRVFNDGFDEADAWLLWMPFASRPPAICRSDHLSEDGDEGEGSKLTKRKPDIYRYFSNGDWFAPRKSQRPSI